MLVLQHWGFIAGFIAGCTQNLPNGPTSEEETYSSAVFVCWHCHR